MVRETRLAPEMSITLCTGHSDRVLDAGWDSNAIATPLLKAVGGKTRARIFTCITYIFFRHRARYIHDHVLVLFDIIVEQINFLWGVDLALENYVFTCQASINCYIILPKMFLEF